MIAGRLLSPLRARDFRLLWFGQTVSLAGNGIFIVALTWHALQVGGGATALGAVLFAYVAPSTVFLLLGGVVTDRLPRRMTMMACDLTQAVVIGAVAVVTIRGDAKVWHLVVVAGLASVANGFFLPASTAVVPEVAPREELVAANSLLAFSRLTSVRLVGPVAGGFLVTAGPGLAFAIDAATFVVSAACLFAIRYRPAASGERPRGRLRAEVAEGFAYCRRHRWLWVSLLAFAVLNLAVSAPLAALIPLYVKEHLGLDARALGLLFGAEGASGALATVVAGNLRAPRMPVVATHAAFGLCGVAMTLMAMTSLLVAAMATLCLVAFLLEIGNVYWSSTLQSSVPDRLIGRVSAADWLASGSLLPVGVAIVGPLAAAFGVGPVFGVGGVLTAAGSLLAVVAIWSRPPGG